MNNILITILFERLCVCVSHWLMNQSMTWLQMINHSSSVLFILGPAPTFVIFLAKIMKILRGKIMGLRNNLMQNVSLLVVFYKLNKPCGDSNSIRFGLQTIKHWLSKSLSKCIMLRYIPWNIALTFRLCVSVCVWLRLWMMNWGLILYFSLFLYHLSSMGSIVQHIFHPIIYASGFHSHWQRKRKWTGRGHVWTWQLIKHWRFSLIHSQVYR